MPGAKFSLSPARSNSEPLCPCRASTCSTRHEAVGEAPLAHPAAPCPDPPHPGTCRPFSSLQLNTLSGDISSDKQRGCARCPCPLGGCATTASSSRGRLPSKDSLKCPMCAQCVLGVCLVMSSVCSWCVLSVSSV